EELSSKPNDDGRDSRTEKGKGTDQLSHVGTEYTDDAIREDVGHPDDNASAKAHCDNLESTILEEKDSESEEAGSGHDHVTEFDDYVEGVVLGCSPDDRWWIEAMNQEMKALNRNGTWIITDLPVGRKPIGSKWVFKVKYKSSREVERFKARLVAKCYNQKEGIDYEETFFPVVKIVTVRCLLTIAVHNSWPIFQLDINKDFFYMVNWLRMFIRVFLKDILIRMLIGPCGTRIETKESTTKPKKVFVDSPLTGVNNY
ncbi:putative RNA-directed DNA polymerase, partial [Tanacetum coccineum]